MMMSAQQEVFRWTVSSGVTHPEDTSESLGRTVSRFTCQSIIARSPGKDVQIFAVAVVVVGFFGRHRVGIR